MSPIFSIRGPCVIPYVNSKKPQRIDEVRGIVADVDVEVIPAAQPAERIGLDVAAQCGRQVARALIPHPLVPRQGYNLCPVHRVLAMSGRRAALISERI